MTKYILPIVVIMCLGCGKESANVLENVRATFIILKENPLEDLSALQSVYGVVQEGTLTAFPNNKED